MQNCYDVIVDFVTNIIHMQLTYLKCKIQQFLMCSEKHKHHHDLISEHCHDPKKEPLCPLAATPQPLGNH